MSHKDEETAKRSKNSSGHEANTDYLRYLDCFNRQLYFEAHEVLEKLWLPRRQGPAGRFYKGLIQLAAAFVHLEKGRLEPARSLLRLARTNLEKYAGIQAGLTVKEILATIDDWHAQLEAGAFRSNPFLTRPPPRLRLSGPGSV